MTVRVAGTVIDGIELFGVLRIEAENVTVKRSIIHGSSTTGAVVFYAGASTVRNLLIEDVEISPSIRTHLTNGIFGHDMTLRRVNVHHVIDSVHIFGGDNVIVENSYLHDNLHFGPEIDPSHADGSHDDNIQIQSGRNIVIRNSAISGSWNAAVQVTQDAGVVSNLTIQDNWIEGGGCALNISEGTRGTIQGLTITGNKFGSTKFNCPILLTAATKAVSTITDNTLLSGGILGLICRATTGNYRC